MSVSRFQNGGRVDTARAALAAVLLFAAVLRVVVYFDTTYILRPDETFQYLEQGHRLAFGSGIVPWEFLQGARSYLLALPYAAVMKVTSLISDDPRLYIGALRLGAATLSLSVVFVGFRWAEDCGGLRAGILAGAMTAFWFEHIYFSTGLMTEEISAYCGLWGLYLGQRSQVGGNRRAMALVGSLFGLAFCIRLQLAPALAVMALWYCRSDRQSWRWLLAGGTAAVLVASGLVDWLTWGIPFRALWGTLTLIGPTAAEFGTEPWYAFPIGIFISWSVLAVPFILLAAVGATRAPALALFAVAIVVSHSWFGHKEYRFIFGALMVAPILVALGVDHLIERLVPVSWRSMAATGFLLTAAAGSYYAAGHGLLASAWQVGRAPVLAFFAAHDQPDLCGLAVDQVEWWRSGGYSYLHRDVPLYYSSYGDTVDGHEPARDKLFRVVLNRTVIPQYPGVDLGKHTDRYNYLIVPEAVETPGFASVACYHENGDLGDRTICLKRRDGRCSR